MNHIFNSSNLPTVAIEQNAFIAAQAIASFLAGKPSERHLTLYFLKEKVGPLENGSRVRIGDLNQSEVWDGEKKAWVKPFPRTFRAEELTRDILLTLKDRGDLHFWEFREGLIFREPNGLFHRISSITEEGFGIQTLTSDSKEWQDGDTYEIYQFSEFVELAEDVYSTPAGIDAVLSEVKNRWVGQFRNKVRWEEHRWEALNNATVRDGEVVAETYIGQLLNPSGKYYTPFANSNVTEEEALFDEIWQEALDLVAEEKGCYFTSGEGDPTDTYLGVLNVDDIRGQVEDLENGDLIEDPDTEATIEVEEVTTNEDGHAVIKGHDIHKIHLYERAFDPKFIVTKVVQTSEESTTA